MQDKKKFVMVVQGEGRGHMTQAITLYDLLISKGHEVPAVLVGTSANREIPKFFYDKIKTRIIKIQSPNFVTDKSSRSIRIGPTVIHNVMNMGVFRKSFALIKQTLEEHKPDVVINFYDLLIGLYYKLNKPSVPLVCIAHQYIYLHGDFMFPKGYLLDRYIIRNYTKLTSSRSVKNLALSFYYLPEEKRNNVTIVPPLLRDEIFELQPENKNFYLAYLVNHGYFEDIVKWHKTNPEFEIHCFTDKTKELERFDYDKNKLFLHELNDKLFIEKMAAAKGLISTAGFESVCEAMYLNKPVLMVPVKGHFEQFCNSRDGHYAGAGVYDSDFNIDKLVSYISSSSKYERENNTEYKRWVNNAKEKIYKELVSITA
ncbi:MAG: glycosyltransferase family protein [Bacteroidia bacterium]